MPDQWERKKIPPKYQSCGRNLAFWTKLSKFTSWLENSRPTKPTENSWRFCHTTPVTSSMSFLRALFNFKNYLDYEWKKRVICSHATRWVRGISDVNYTNWMVLQSLHMVFLILLFFFPRLTLFPWITLSFSLIYPFLLFCKKNKTKIKTKKNRLNRRTAPAFLTAIRGPSRRREIRR